MSNLQNWRPSGSARCEELEAARRVLAEERRKAAALEVLEASGSSGPSFGAPGSRSKYHQESGNPRVVLVHVSIYQGPFWDPI